MLLKDIFEEIQIKKCNANMDISAGKPVFDSRKIKQGDTFFALNGNSDGNLYVDEAIKKEVSLIVSEKFYDGYFCVQVENVRKAFALYCSAYYGHPEKKVKIIGVTGTNGKTSTTKILSHILEKNNYKTALIGTFGAIIDGKKVETGMTTPDADTFYELLSYAARVNTDYVIMEVSAHAIFYEKIYGVRFDYCIFTNLSRDHLDFFETMENYGKVKKSLFMGETVACAVVNNDDSLGREIIRERRGKTLSYGINDNSQFKVTDKTYASGIKFSALLNGEEVDFETNLSGEFNLYNLLSAIAVCFDIGISAESIKSAVKRVPEIEGRFNTLYNGKYTVIIDYAHTPDGLEKILTAARRITTNNLICVFGCGGNRDKEKRPIMGKIGVMYSDLCIVTSDNPRFEEPEEIISEICKGCKSAGNNYIAVTDRKRAIEFALRIASDGDAVLIAGKGAENYIDVKGVKYPFSDKEICEEAMKKL